MRKLSVSLQPPPATLVVSVPKGWCDEEKLVSNHQSAVIVRIIPILCLNSCYNRYFVLYTALFFRKELQ